MDIHPIYGFFFRATGFRRRRMALFEKMMRPDHSTKILDIGGSLGNWNYLSVESQITLLNLDTTHNRDDYPANISFEYGSALSVPFEDNTFDIAFSNSVIEHLGEWHHQQLFAREVKRIASRFWIQTPAREFFFEPHLLTPFVHWLPILWQQRLLGNFTVWGWIRRPTTAEVSSFLSKTRLLTGQEMRTLFPSCEIYEEKWIGLTKSYIAYKNQ